MPKKWQIKARRQCYDLANAALKLPLFFAEPIPGVAEPEINYYSFTLLNSLSSPPVSAFSLPTNVANIALPVVWNYLDGACALAVGLQQLIDEDNYRQKQMKIKGLLNIFSGMQLFLLSYNPPLVAALGITGAPAALAGTSFAIAMVVDAITAAIDFANAWKEREINGWLEERCQEYLFLQKRIQSLTEEAAITQNRVIREKIAALQLQKDNLAETISLRYRVNRFNINKRQLSLLEQIIAIEDTNATAEDYLKDAEIQVLCEKKYTAAGSNLLVKLASLIGMMLLAASVIALLTTVPSAVPFTGLAITVLVAAVYFYRHQQEIRQTLGKVAQTLGFFSKSSPLVSPAQEESAADVEESVDDITALQN